MQSTDKKKLALILNASAGSGCARGVADSFVDKFRAYGLEASVTLAKDGNALVSAAEDAVGQGMKIVVAGGGDGTLNAVASSLVGTDIVFGVLPLGTLNHFAKDLGIPLDIDAAIATIGEGHRAKVDTAEVNGHVFLNNSSLGLYPETVRHRELQQSRLGRSKWLAFFWAAVTSLRRYPFLHVTISVNGQSFHQRTPFIFIGNNNYVMEGFKIGARTRLDSGRLSLYFAKGTSRLGLLLLAVRALFGRLRQAKDFVAFSENSLRIESRHKKLRVSTDGEVTLMSTPLVYRSCPASLNVFVPRKAAGD